MKNSWQLLKILQGQLETCSEYLEIQKKKTDALIIGDIRRLDAIVRDEQSYVMKMESYENKRDRILSESELPNVTISQIIADYLEEEYTQQYQEVFEKLSNIIEELRKVHLLNQRLLKQRLSVVNAILANAENDGAFSIDDINGAKGSTKFPKEKTKRA